ncbi:hypothetical protein [Heyndrickxia acidicola]|uniref:Uncharacterized protein n=1 Tax=Heyndrickxia acidicola TaxID=209389 RepID=A0ABU6MJV8_9BACI|nr:hypothetical protein [Heyndrickxia acidicola]MED1204964.1 hypothetical protein [Heyndrickxia acidicola]
MLGKKKVILLMVVLPWCSLPFLGVRSIKRYLPGALFMSCFLLAEGLIAEKKRWWRFFGKYKPNVLGEIPLIIGPFFIGSLWILKYTYGKFKRYMAVNTIVDSFFIYLVLIYFKKINYASLVRLKKFQLSMIFLIKSISMYGFQFLFEKLFTRPKSKSTLPDD